MPFIQLSSSHGVLVIYIAFTEDAKAVTFERYLKTGSGRAFANQRLW